MQLPLPNISLLLAFLCMLAGVAVAKDSNGYFDGRATYYTDNTEGSCRYGKPDTVYYAAWPNVLEGAPNCGKCFEISCKNRDFNDGYGHPVQRSSACYDENKKVVVKIIDSCPCVHQNFYSNQRWCCGDMEHLDVSEEVFKMLADEHWGVIGLKWKETSCDKLGEVGGNSYDNSDNGKGKDSENDSDDGKADDSGDKEDDDQSGSDRLHGHEGWDTTWVKHKVSDWRSKLDDHTFEKRWQETVDGTWLSKFKSERPSWVKSTFGGWRR